MVKTQSWQDKTNAENERSSHQTCSVKKMFLEILQNSQENTSTRLFLNKIADQRLQEIGHF